MIDPSAKFDLLILPGLGNSGVDHWQSHWLAGFPNATRVLQDDWARPKLADWLTRLVGAIAEGTRPAILVCHRLSCTLAAHWAARAQPGRVVAAFLVAPSDVESPAHTPDEIRNFAPMPRRKFPVPSLVVASVNDPFVALARAQDFATDWGADFCNVGELGHVNSATRLDLWPQGLLLLGRLIDRVEADPVSAAAVPP
jgi:predicted alpha/beta hydrolase family esterase